MWDQTSKIIQYERGCALALSSRPKSLHSTTTNRESGVSVGSQEKGDREANQTNGKHQYTSSSSTTTTTTSTPPSALSSHHGTFGERSSASSYPLATPVSALEAQYWYDLKRSIHHHTASAARSHTHNGTVQNQPSITKRRNDLLHYQQHHHDDAKIPSLSLPFPLPSSTEEQDFLAELQLSIDRAHQNFPAHLSTLAAAATLSSVTTNNGTQKKEGKNDRKGGKKSKSSSSSSFHVQGLNALPEPIVKGGGKAGRE